MTMDGINTSSSSLPVGFRFHPTDQELILHYLKKKISSSSPNPVVSIIADVDIYKFNPWDLPDKAVFGENEWFFFSPRERKYPNGGRPNRTAASGYWKATGIDKPILTSDGKQCLGVKKALVFYKGRPPKGIKTNWTMLEYRLPAGRTSLSQRLRGSMRLDDWVLCRVRQKSRNSIEIGENSFTASGSISPPITPAGYLQDQQMIAKHSNNNNNNFMEVYNVQLQASFMASLDSEEAEDQQGQTSEVHEGYPGNSVSAVDSNFQTPAVSSIKEALESIKRVLSLGGLDELAPLTPRKRLNTSTASNFFEDAKSIFQVSSPTTTSAACARYFSEFAS